MMYKQVESLLTFPLQTFSIQAMYGASTPKGGKRVVGVLRYTGDGKVRMRHTFYEQNKTHSAKAELKTPKSLERKVRDSLCFQLSFFSL